MEIEVSKKELNDALSRISIIAEKKNIDSILENILVKTVGDDRLCIFSTDLNISAKCVLPVKLIAEGSVVVNTKTFLSIVRNMSEGIISLKVRKGTQEKLFISSGKSRFNLVSLDAEDYPSIPKEPNGEVFYVNSGVISDMISKTSFSIGKDESRSINNALFEGKENELVMVSTDGHRLSRYGMKVDGCRFDFSMLLPHKTVRELNKFLKGLDGSVSISIIDRSAFFNVKTDDFEFVFVSQVFDHGFPDYNQIIPDLKGKEVLVSRDEFLKSLKRLMAVSTDNFKGLKFTLQFGNIDLLFDNPSIGSANEIVDVVYDGESFETSFNIKYMIDILSVLDCDEIKLIFGNGLDPIVVKDIADEFIGVVMPMRI